MLRGGTKIRFLDRVGKASERCTRLIVPRHHGFSLAPSTIRLPMRAHRVGDTMTVDWCETKGDSSVCMMRTNRSGIKLNANVDQIETKPDISSNVTRMFG